MPRLPLVSIVLALMLACVTHAQRVTQKPAALVFEHVDQWTQSAQAAELLAAAGFEVQSLPLHQSPADLDADVIVFGSFACEHPEYATYMREYADDLCNFVEKGHLLVELTQADQFESKPPFLPSTLGAQRSDQDFENAVVLAPGHPLMKGLVPAAGAPIHFSHGRTIWETFVDQSGFEVLIAGDENGQYPAMIEGAFGQGRILLIAMALDKANFDRADDASLFESYDAFRRTFFANLAAHVLSVRNSTAPAIRVTLSPRGVREFVPGSWTLAVLPDTQVYSLQYPGLFTAQTGWMVQNRERLNIRMALQLGDIVNNNTPREWRNARDAMRLLDGVVPYALVPGNHDYGPAGDASTRDTLLNEYFRFDDVVAANRTFGGAMEAGKLDNSYHLFDAGGRKWIIIALEWGPRDAAIAWANEVMTRYPDRLGIFVTHAFLNNNDLRYDHTDKNNPQDYNPHNYRTPGGVNDGEELWQKLVRKHRFVLAINGHVLGDGAGYRADPTDAGTVCHQILVNYQMRELGGEGYLRLLEFQPDGVTVRVKSYSPVFDRYMLEPDQQWQFTLKF